MWNDISNWQRGYQVSGPVVCKAGEGVAYTDPTYQGFVGAADRLGVFGGAYYALHSGDPAGQARRAAGIIGHRPMMFDVEDWPAESGSPAGIASLPEVLTAIDTLRATGGVTNVIYLPRSQWQRMGSPDLAPLRLRKIAIINADYRAGSSDLSHPAWSAIGGSPVFAVQYAPEHNVAAVSWPDAAAIWQAGTTVTPTVPPAHNGATYVVQPGDTLSRIAAQHGIPLAELEALNPGAGHPAGHFDDIWPGDVVRIVPTEVGSDSYRVRAGDTLSGIADRFHMPLQMLLRLNPHAGHPAGNVDDIWPGDVIAVHA
jgi:LysM repeat protein